MSLSVCPWLNNKRCADIKKSSTGKDSSSQHIYIFIVLVVKWLVCSLLGLRLMGWNPAEDDGFLLLCMTLYPNTQMLEPVQGFSWLFAPYMFRQRDIVELVSWTRWYGVYVFLAAASVIG